MHADFKLDYIDKQKCARSNNMQANSIATGSGRVLSTVDLG